MNLYSRVGCSVSPICLAVALLISASVTLQGQNTNASVSQTNGQAAQAQQTPSSPQPGQLADSTTTAPPLTVEGKFKYHIVRSFGLRGLLGNLAGAAIGQGTNTPSEWGQGWGAYAERYASGLGNTFSRQIFAFTLDSVLHEDPRYFPSVDRSKGARIKNVLRSVLIARTDSGEDRFAYSHVISAFGAGQLVNAWQPRSTGHISDGIERAFIILGVDAGYNLAQEFVPFLRPKPLKHRP